MAQAGVPYAAVPRGSSDGRVHFSDEVHESDADVEDNGLFEHRETMEVADNDTLYYGMSLGTRRRMRK
ncbi:hypothetical protein GGH98_004491, partial [Coemansia sp. RSA 454]